MRAADIDPKSEFCNRMYFSYPTIQNQFIICLTAEDIHQNLPISKDCVVALLPSLELQGYH